MKGEEGSTALSGPVVIDASAVVEYLVDLTLTDAATRLFRLAAGRQVELWAPDLVYSESTSALRKLVQLRALPAAAAGQAVERLEELPIIAVGTARLLSAVWRMRTFLTPYDACYVALADALAATFVTGERELASELRKRRKRARFLGDL